MTEYLPSLGHLTTNSPREEPVDTDWERAAATTVAWHGQRPDLDVLNRILRGLRRL